MKPDEDLPPYYDDDDDHLDDCVFDEDEDDLLDDECGLREDGTCALAGSEWCDWSCPLDRRARSSKGG